MTNPLYSIAIIACLIIGLGLAFTGINLSMGEKRSVGRCWASYAFIIGGFGTLCVPFAIVLEAVKL